MKNELEKKIDRYLKEIGTRFFSSRREKKRLIHTLREEIDYFIAEHPQTDMQRIMEVFGSPDQIAAESIDSEKYQKTVHAKEIMLEAVMILNILFAVFLTAEWIAGHIQIQRN